MDTMSNAWKFTKHTQEFIFEKEERVKEGEGEREREKQRERERERELETDYFNGGLLVSNAHNYT